MLVLDGLASEWQQAERAPHVGIAVLRRGALLHAAGYGGAAADTIYQTASVGKHFTAALALLLSGSGELPPLDLSIAGCLPELAKGWSGITLRQLLSHTAGVPTSGYESIDFTREWTDSELTAEIGSQDLEFEPGTRWKYSNAGYVLAGIAIGRSTGRFYGDLLGERVFVPLGMTTATVTPADGPVGYVWEDQVLKPATYVSATLNRLADGGLCLSAVDFVRWDAALWSEWGGAVAEMFTETKLKTDEPTGYGLGWFLSDGDHGRVAEHDGGWQGFSTAIVRNLDHGITAVVLADVAGADATGLAHELVNAAAGPAMLTGK